MNSATVGNPLRISLPSRLKEMKMIKGRGYTGAIRTRMLNKQPITAVFTGDSTAWGQGEQNPYSPPALFGRIMQAGHFPCTIFNRAIGGTTSDDWARDDGMLDDHLAEFATNPPHFYDLRTTVNDVPTDLCDVEASLRYGLQKLRAAWPRATTTVNIASPSDFNTGGFGFLDAVEPILEALAAEFECSFLNLRAYGAEWWLSTDVDKGHPNSAANLMYSEAYADLLRATALISPGYPIAKGVSLQDGWKAFGNGYPTPTIYLGSDGYVNGEGVCDRTSVANDGAIFFTLQPAVCPAIPVMLRPAGGCPDARIVVRPDGMAFGYGLSHNFTSFDGLRWRLA